MSSESGTPPPSQHRNDTSGERRREARRVLVSRCQIVITSPPWAITPRPVIGRAININNIGMKVGAIPASPEQETAWREAIQDDVDLKVEVRVLEQDRLPLLNGRLVWVYPEEPGPDGNTCSFGILFAVMKESTRESLAAVVKDLPERF